MILLSLLALFNGLFIGLARALNGRLTVTNGAFSASFWNHVGGFIFLTLLVFAVDSPIVEFQGIPAFVYWGGAIGAFYVVVNSYIVPKLGATVATMLVISGQLVSGAFIDTYRGLLRIDWSLHTLQLAIGILLIATGVYFSFMSRKS